MVSSAAQIISTLVPFFLVIVAITLVLYFVLNPPKRRCCRSNQVSHDSKSKNPDETQIADRKDADDVKVPGPPGPVKVKRQKSVSFKLTKSIIFPRPSSKEGVNVQVFGGSAISVSSSTASSDSYASEVDSTAGSLVNLLPMGKEDQLRKPVPNAANTVEIQQASTSNCSKTTQSEPKESASPSPVKNKKIKTFCSRESITQSLSSSSFSELSFTSTSSSGESDSELDSSSCTGTTAGSHTGTGSATATGSGTGKGSRTCTAKASATQKGSGSSDTGTASSGSGSGTWSATDSSSDSSWSSGSTYSGSSSDSSLDEASSTGSVIIHQKEQGTIETVCVQIEPEPSEDIQIQKKEESSCIEQGDTSSVTVQIEPDSNKPNSELNELPQNSEQSRSPHFAGIAQGISITVQGPSTSPSEFTPVESPYFLTQEKIVSESSTDTDAEVKSSNAKILVVEELSKDSGSFQERPVDDKNIVNDVDVIANELDAEAIVEQGAISCSSPQDLRVTEDKTLTVKVEERNRSVVTDPLEFSSAVPVVRDIYSESSSAKVVSNNDLFLGEEDTLSAIIDLYEKSLDCATEREKKVDETRASSESSVHILPESESDIAAVNSELEKVANLENSRSNSPVATVDISFVDKVANSENSEGNSPEASVEKSFVDKQKASSAETVHNSPEVIKANSPELPHRRESPEQQALSTLGQEEEGLQPINTGETSPYLVQPADPTLPSPQVGSPSEETTETDMAAAQFQAGTYENIAKLCRIDGEDDLKSQDPVVMPPLRLHGVVIPEIPRNQPDKTPGDSSSESDTKTEKPKISPRTSGLPKFRQLSMTSPEKRLPTVESTPLDSSLGVKMRTFTIPGLPSTVEPVRSESPVSSKELTDSDSVSDVIERPKITPIQSEKELLHRPTMAPVKLMNDHDVSVIPNYTIEERAAVEQLRNKLRQRERLKLAFQMMEEHKKKSRKSWEKKLLSGSETETKTDVSPKPPPQGSKHKCRHHHHHHRRRRSTNSDKDSQQRDSENSPENNNSAMSEDDLMLKKLGRNMRARDRRLNTPLNPMEEEASARSQDLLKLLNQSQKATDANNPVILFTRRSQKVKKDIEEEKSIVSDSAQPLAMSSIDKINSDKKKSRKAHRMLSLKTPFDKPIPEGSNVKGDKANPEESDKNNVSIDSQRSDYSVMSDSAVDPWRGARMTGL